MGFGHRVYRAEDPRSRILKRTAKELGAPRVEVAEELEKAAHAVVAIPRGRLDLVVPVRPELGELALGASRASELLCARRGLRQLHQTAESEREPGPT